LKTNILQSDELGYRRVVVSLFYGHHSAHVFIQKTPLGLARVKEQQIEKKDVIKENYC
jgi:hypothetical protein